MSKLNSTQLIGIAMVLLGIGTQFLVESHLIQTLLGVLCAIGVGFIFKWIPFRKENLN